MAARSHSEPDFRARAREKRHVLHVGGIAAQDACPRLAQISGHTGSGLKLVVSTASAGARAVTVQDQLPVRSEVIDDCALARVVNRDGGRIRMGLTRISVSLRKLRLLRRSMNP